MGRIGETIQRLRDWWLLGAYTLFLIGCALLAGAVVAVPFALVLGAWLDPSGNLDSWVVMLAPVWAPIWVGALMAYFNRYPPPFLRRAWES